MIEEDLEQLYRLFVPKQLFNQTEYELKERIRTLEKEVSELKWWAYKKDSELKEK